MAYQRVSLYLYYNDFFIKSHHTKDPIFRTLTILNDDYENWIKTRKNCAIAKL